MTEIEAELRALLAADARASGCTCTPEIHLSVHPSNPDTVVAHVAHLHECRLHRAALAPYN